MNVHAITDGLTLAEQAIDLLKSAQSRLSSGKKKEELGQLLLNAESKFKEAEARIGHELGFHICKRCWPPEIMINNEEGHLVCRHCGGTSANKRSVDPIEKDDLSTW